MGFHYGKILKTSKVKRTALAFQIARLIMQNFAHILQISLHQ